VLSTSIPSALAWQSLEIAMRKERFIPIKSNGK
jgi:hypothetical protein